MPAAYICLKPEIVRAQTLKDRLNECDRSDRMLLKQQKIKDLLEWHDSKYESVIKGFEKKENIIDDLIWIKVMYGRPPLDTFKRMRVRNIISCLLEKETLTPEERDFLVSILEHYHCV